MKRLLPKNPGTALRNQNGFALLLSLLIVVLLVIIIFEADYQIRADLRAAGNFRDDLKAEYLARSGISAGEALLKDDAKNSAAYDGVDEFWAAPIPEYPLGDGLLSGFIVDEERKININKLVNQSTGKVIEKRQAQLMRLFELLEVNPDLTDAIVDWIDPDDVPMPYGAESPSYQAGNPGYAARNGAMQTLEELYMVRGITNAIYAEISPYLTVYGEGAININTADTLVLQSFDLDLDESVARRIIEKRPFDEPTTWRSEFRDLLSTDVINRIGDWQRKDSQFFTLRATGQVNDTFKTVSAVVRRVGQQTTLYYFRMQ